MRVEAFACTVGTGHSTGNPQTFALTFAPGYLDRVDVVIPDGVAGLAGFQLAYSGQQIVPENAGGWITGNDEKFSADVEVAYVGEQWQLIAYNTDLYSHTFQVRCYVRELSEPANGTAIPAQVPTLAISPGTGFGDASLTLDQPDFSSLGSLGASAAGDTTPPAPVIDTTLGEPAPPPDTGDVAPAPELDTTLGEAPAVSDV